MGDTLNEIEARVALVQRLREAASANRRGWFAADELMEEAADALAVDPIRTAFSYDEIGMLIDGVARFVQSQDAPAGPLLKRLQLAYTRHVVGASKAASGEERDG